MFIALKPCKFAGRDFRTGDTVPVEIVDVRAVRRLKKQRILAETNEQKEVVKIPVLEQSFTVPILADGNELSVELEAEELKTLFIVLQSTADKAGKLATEQTNKDLLLCIHALDTRKTVQSAAKDRAMALNETVSAENETELPETAE